MKTIQIAVGLSITFLLAACSSAGPDTGDPEAGEQSDATTFNETVVHLNPDGTQTVKEGTITMAEELRQNAARAGRQDASDPSGLGTAEEAIAQDNSCAGASFWAYDQVNNVGNRICFSGTGIADLSQYVHHFVKTPQGFYIVFWGSEVRSYYSGVDTGYFQDSGNPVGCLGTDHCAPFGAYQSDWTLTACEKADSRYLNLGQVCSAPIVVQDGQAPMGAAGYYFSPNGSVRGEIWKGNVLKAQYNKSADATGYVYFGFGNPMISGSNASCGEILKFTDMATSTVATTQIFGACF